MPVAAGLAPPKRPSALGPPVRAASGEGDGRDDEDEDSVPRRVEGETTAVAKGVAAVVVVFAFPFVKVVSLSDRDRVDDVASILSMLCPNDQGRRMFVMSLVWVRGMEGRQDRPKTPDGQSVWDGRRLHQGERVEEDQAHGDEQWGQQPSVNRVGSMHGELRSVRANEREARNEPTTRWRDNAQR